MSATVGARLGIQVGTILGSIVIALGGLIHLASTARLGDSAGAGEAFMPAIIVRGTIHGMDRLGWRLLGWPLGTSPSLLSRLLFDSK